MKIKGKYVLRDIAGEIVAVSVGETVLYSNVLVALNETGAFIWKLLSAGIEKQELINKVMDEYKVDEETVREDINDFINYLKSNKVEVE